MHHGQRKECHASSAPTSSWSSLRRFRSLFMSSAAWMSAVPFLSGTPSQGLTLVHFSAQRKRFLRDRGCIEGLFRGYYRV